MFLNASWIEAEREQTTLFPSFSGARQETLQISLIGTFQLVQCCLCRVSDIFGMLLIAVAAFGRLAMFADRQRFYLVATRTLSFHRSNVHQTDQEKIVRQLIGSLSKLDHFPARGTRREQIDAGRKRGKYATRVSNQSNVRRCALKVPMAEMHPTAWRDSLEVTFQTGQTERMLTRENLWIFEAVETNAAFQKVLKILDLVHVAHVR